MVFSSASLISECASKGVYARRVRLAKLQTNSTTTVAGSLVAAPTSFWSRISERESGKGTK